MNPEEEENSFQLFKDVVVTAIQEKEKIPKWKKKLDAADVRVSFVLLVSEEDTAYVNLIINKGQYSINKERIEDYTIEIVADPVHLVGFVSKEYSILNMLLTGKWKIKNLLRYPFTSLFIANLLVYS
ncbi:MAG: hypothetical protein EU530_08320 [Promethearchaeota archaeon]|nr:MAG: hypothetical protein EU530_08320 [Candidatus Lokiarchaeota archaeon]